MLLQKIVAKEPSASLSIRAALPIEKRAQDKALT